MGYKKGTDKILLPPVSRRRPKPWALRPNGDLWQIWEKLAYCKGLRSIKVSWVKGHATQAHVDRGVTSWRDKCGNDAADALAPSAAAAHAAPVELRAGTERRGGHAKAVHTLACEILAMRAEHIESLADSLPVETEPG